MNFEKRINSRGGVFTVYYTFNNGDYDYVLFIERITKLGQTQHSISFGISQDNAFSFNIDLNSFNVYGMRSNLYELLDDYEANYVSCETPSYYYISYLKSDSQYATKFSFTLSSLRERYGTNNVLIDVNNSIIVELCN